MTFEEWLTALAPELAASQSMTLDEAQAYIKDTGPECWRDMFEDELSPRDAADEEAHAAAWMGA